MDSSPELPPTGAPPPLPRPRQHLLTAPRVLAALALAAVTAAAGLLFLRDPGATPGLFPRCLWHVATGTWCPGCGITRALHALLHGDLLAALDFNAVGLLVLLTTAALLVRPACIALAENRWAPPVLPRHTARWLLVGALVWALLRNLPWPPFTLLAP